MKRESSTRRETRRLRAPEGLAEAARLLRAGGLVAFPTETVYGLGALALEPLAVRAIYAAKGRPANNPVIVHVLDVAGALPLLAEWPALAQRLSDAFWPGPLTLVLPRSPLVPDEVTAGGPTVAVRAPSHPVARALLELVGAPLAAPSANRAEHVSPTSAAHALADLDGGIDAVLDGGPCALGIESTVLQLASDGSVAPRILREGSVTRAQLEPLCGPLADNKQSRLFVFGGANPLASADTLTPVTVAGAVAASPGLGRRHYAPAGVVRLARAGQLAQLAARFAPALVGALLHSEAAVEALGAKPGEAPAGPFQPIPGQPYATLRLPADAAGYARALYAALRELEARGCSAIVIEEVPEGGDWDAIRDRLARAAG